LSAGFKRVRGIMERAYADWPGRLIAYEESVPTVEDAK
jgi:hypothetical protein